MALSEAQRADIRYYCGYSARHLQTDVSLEQAMWAIETQPAHEAQITNPITGDPSGLLAQLKDIDSKLRGAHARLKASEVGSIKLNPGEMAMLRSEGRRLATRLCSILGVEKRTDVFGGSGASGNYVGK